MMLYVEEFVLWKVAYYGVDENITIKGVNLLAPRKGSRDPIPEDRLFSLVKDIRLILPSYYLHFVCIFEQCPWI